MAYATTTVPVERSQGELRKLLTRHNAQRFSFSEGRPDGEERTWVQVEFVHVGNFERPMLIRLGVPLKLPDDADLRAKAQRSRTKYYVDLRHEAEEQELRRIWRVIYYSLKARLEAVEEELETFEQAFLPHIVEPTTGLTIWQMVEKPIGEGRLAIGGGGLALTAGKGSS